MLYKLLGSGAALSGEYNSIEWEKLEISPWKLRDTKAIFHAKMGTVKDRNGTNLTEAEVIKKWQEHTEELY